MRFWIDEPALDYALTSTKPVRHNPCGTAKRRAKGYGNAVTPPAARDLVACVAESLGVAA